MRILVLRGGPGAERKISLWSGQLIAQALRDRGHSVREGDINPDDVSSLDGGDFDVVFPIIHGTFGEDGQLQRILESRGLKYVGTDSAGSELAMNKQRTKEAFARTGLLVPKGELIESRRQDESNKLPAIQERVRGVVGRFGLPCVVKPNAEGSSVGVTIAKTEAAAVAAAANVLENYGDCLIEEFIRGREMTVGMIGETVLPVLEVRPKGGFYDWQAKYEADDTEYVFETGLPADRVGQITEECRKAFLAVGCRDLGRVDFIMDVEGRDWFLEVNTLPGFTDHSLVPKAAGRLGWSFGEICEKIVQLAGERPIKGLWQKNEKQRAPKMARSGQK